MDKLFSCANCLEAFETASEAAKHHVSVHPTKNITITGHNANGQARTRRYKIKGEDIDQTSLDIEIDARTGKLIIPTTMRDTDSPVHKMKKVNTPTKHVHKQLFSEYIEPGETELIGDIDLMSETPKDTTDYDMREMDMPITVGPDRLKQIVERLERLLPAVTEHMVSKGRLEEWTTFFKLIKADQFHVDHIASQLFWDVIKFKKVGNVHGMRFTPEVKEFWTVGLSMFHSKFIRFMGGIKAQGLLHDGTSRTDLESDVTRVNFVCPDVKKLREEKKTRNIECGRPGIIASNIEAVADLPGSKEKPYKICIDGKKITAGFGKMLGEVDLFGHETSPTLEEKRNRLDIEKLQISNALKEISKLIEMDKDEIMDLVETSQSSLYSDVIDTISILTERIRELRVLKVKRLQAIDKFITLAGEPWQKSTYSYVISSMKTQLLKMNMCIDEALRTIDRLGLVAAACNRVMHLYSIDKSVDLNQQSNYVCLREVDISEGYVDAVPCNLVKQRSKQWFKIREQAKATGSTLHKAIGLGTLKDQKGHIDKLQNPNISVERTLEEQRAMQHGIDNEINCVGVLVTKVLPVYAPTHEFFEEGCYRVQNCNSEMIVSPDGSCRSNGKPTIGVEIKCPKPGKIFTTDVHYKIPVYYVPQILSEMKALDCSTLFYMCWTPESCTVLRARFQEELWSALAYETDITFPHERALVKPKRKSENVPRLKEMIRQYVENNVDLIAEFPSMTSANCCHSETVGNADEARGYHSITKHKDNPVKDTYAKLPEVGQVLMKAKKCVDEMYNVLRTPGKEVLVAVLSDLDRIKQSEHTHAVPIAYGISGYSLRVDVVRSLMDDICKACEEKGIKVLALSSDGQFYRLCVRNSKDEPLTILQLAKDTWAKVRKMTKQDQISRLMEVNKVCRNDEIHVDVHQNESFEETNQTTGPMHVFGIKGKPWTRLYTPPKFDQLVKVKCKQGKTAKDETTPYDHLPPEVINSLPSVEDSDAEDCVLEHIQKSSGDSCFEDQGSVETLPPAMESTAFECVDNEDEMSSQECQMPKDDVDPYHEDSSLPVFASIATALRETDIERKKSKWNDINETKVRELLMSEPNVLMSKFTKKELYQCGLHIRDEIESHSNLTLDKMTKVQLANAFAIRSGHQEKVTCRKSPKTLRGILKDYLTRSVSKEALNAVTATAMFLHNELPNWRAKATFKNGIEIANQPEPYMWYSQPEELASVGHHVVYLLDCHHLFVNARSYVMQNGITGLGISKQAWIDVAENNSNSNVGLNIAMVKDVIDRQSNAIAQITFSDKVEGEMRRMGWNNEADFCRTIRDWYRAEDEPGLDVSERHHYRMKMRELLLGAVHLAEFPPPGSHVAGMPIVMFEGILTNIDRRIQLYALCPENVYNVRAPNSLDAENLFSEFRELDPKSTGALLADDIPSALETASYILQMRLNPERKYLMHTAKTTRVYPAKELHGGSCDGFESQPWHMLNRTVLQDLTSITMRNHIFDITDRKGRKPKRKVAYIPDIDQPARGTQPVRQHHKMDSSKILPHIRHGLSDI